jgi:hypothetical protein
MEKPSWEAPRIHRELLKIKVCRRSGVRQGLYYLQDQMEERQGPYLPMGSVLRATALPAIP